MPHVMANIYTGQQRHSPGFVAHPGGQVSWVQGSVRKHTGWGLKRQTSFFSRFWKLARPGSRCQQLLLLLGTHVLALDSCPRPGRSHELSTLGAIEDVCSYWGIRPLQVTEHMCTCVCTRAHTHTPLLQTLIPSCVLTLMTQPSHLTTAPRPATITLGGGPGCVTGGHVPSITLCFAVSFYTSFYVSEGHFSAGIPTLHLRQRGAFCSDTCTSSTRSRQMPSGWLGTSAE